MTGTSETELTLGPVLFNWPAEKWRDFYFRMADEAPLDVVYLGETVCLKRLPFIEPHLADVAERLLAAGKQVVFSTLALVMNRPERQALRAVAEGNDLTVEANDASALAYLRGRPHVIGPYMNVYNEDTLEFLASEGARRFCLPPEVPQGSLAPLIDRAGKLDVMLELFAYGRMPLAVSARCYHARAHKLSKDNCQFVCEQDPDGLELDTLDDEPFLTINGIQTMSHTCQNLLPNLAELQEMGIGAFRLSPHSHDMVAVAEQFRGVLDGRLDVGEALARLEDDGLDIPFSNGFLSGKAGSEWRR